MIRKLENSLLTNKGVFDIINKLSTDEWLVADLENDTENKKLKDS